MDEFFDGLPKLVFIWFVSFRHHGGEKFFSVEAALSKYRCFSCGDESESTFVNEKSILHLKMPVAKRGRTECVVVFR